MGGEDAAAGPAPGDKRLVERIELLEVAVVDADNGAITNARKMEALAGLDELLPAMPRPEVVEQQAKVEDLVERLLAQNATEPLRRLAVCVLNKLYLKGNSSALPTLVGRLLKTTGEGNKKITNDTRVAALHVIGELMVLHGRAVEHYSTDIFVVVAKHMKLTDANARCSAFQCLTKTITVAGLKTLSIASNIWKMLAKMLLDKDVRVRTSAAHSLTALMVASPPCGGANGDAMAVACLKALSVDDQASGQSSMLSSECRYAFAVALANVLAAMAGPAAFAGQERPKKKPLVSDFASACDFLEQAAAKGPASGPAFVGFRAAICVAAVKTTAALEVGDCKSLNLLMRMLLNLLDAPPAAKSRGGAVAEDDSLPQLARDVSGALRHVLNLVQNEATLLDIIETGLLPLINANVTEVSRATETRMQVVLDTLSSACIKAGEGFKAVETKVKQPLLHIVGNHPSPVVQLHATYCMRSMAHCSPPQLFQLMSVLLNHITVQNAELLGAPLRPRPGVTVASQLAELQPLLRGLFGHCAALAALVGELFHSDLGVPHDVTSAVLGTSRALLQPHPNAHVSSQRRSCAFILLEGLMCVGTDWVGQRLTTLFALWKTALGKKPVDRAKVQYQQHVAAQSSQDPKLASADTGSEACRDELLSLLCALRSLYAFTLHSHDTLLMSLPHLHKILVVFLTNISQLVVALPHPTSASLRAKYKSEAAGQGRPVVTLATHFTIPDILLMIRTTMYHTFAAMLPAQYSSRFVPLLNMLADDVTRPVPADFPASELLAHSLHPEDLALDLVDPYVEASFKDGSATSRLAVARLLSGAGGGKGPEKVEAMPPKDLMSDAVASCQFSWVPKEGPASVEGLLTPWDSWFDPKRPLVEQCTSGEWDWRNSAVKLLAIIMNSGEVSEQARAAVLVHLLKKRESAEDAGSKRGAAPAAPSDLTVIPSLGVLAYLKEHVKARGIKVAPPATQMQQVLENALGGLKEPNPVVRRLHVELLAMLFYIHHQLPDSPVVPTILQHIGSDTSSDSPAVRSAIALLCGAILRAFEWGGRQTTGQDKLATLHSPYLMNIVPSLIRLAKETSQPVRLWMLHAIHLSMQAAGTAFAPFLKDALRLGTAHLLADFFESPIVLWVIAQLVRSAASTCGVTDASDADLREENIGRILGIWNELKQVHYVASGASTSFATIRTEALCISTAHTMVQTAPTALSQLKDVYDLVMRKLAPEASGGSCSSAVRTAAARCLTDLAGPGLSIGQSGAIIQDPAYLFLLLEEAQGPEAAALEGLIKALVKQRGLLQLSMWLQALKQIVLALPPKSAGGGAPPAAKTAEDGAEGGDDDGAGITADAAPAAAGGLEIVFRAATSPTKAFAVACVQLLLEQANPDDVVHFQTQLPGEDPPIDRGAPENRLVTHLDTVMGIASQASSCEEATLASAGLQLMLLIVKLFRNTKDVAGQVDGAECPPLLVQFEAQLGTCMRHNLREEANPLAVRLALELLRSVIAAKAVNSTGRTIGLLMQPFASATFEPDPLFCECASTTAFIYRLNCACELLDSDEEDSAVVAHTKDLARWIENMLRDCSVLLAGLPMPSIKTYQPVCFSLADYKAVQPCFREAIPTILRGICALCGDKRPLPQGSATAPPDLVELALGLVSLVLGSTSSHPPEDEMRIYLRTMRCVFLSSRGNSKAAGDSGAVVSSKVTLAYFLDVMGHVWHHIFRVPVRCQALLPDLLELIHGLSGALWRHWQKTRAAEDAKGPEPPSTPSGQDGWLDALCRDTEAGQKGRGTLGAYCFHVVAASLRSPAVASSAETTTLALDIFAWWLKDALPRGLDESASDDVADKEEDELVAKALEDGGEVEGASGIQTCTRCHWLWLLFLSPFPVDLMQAQPAVTLKYWKVVCALLSSPAVALQSAAHVQNQLLFLALIANRLSKSLVRELEERGESMSEAEERTVVYSFAMLVPVLAALCAALQNATGSSQDATQNLKGNVKAAVNTCLEQITSVFQCGLSHPNVKVVQTTVSSSQNLLQNPVCALLGPRVIPTLVAALVRQSPALPAVAQESAWGAIAAMHASQSASNEMLQATTALVLKMVACIAQFGKGSPGSFTAQTAAMAQCLMAVARADPSGLKAEVAGMSPDGQQTVQQLLREHMSAAAGGAQGASGGAGEASPAKPKIQLKIKF